MIIHGEGQKGIKRQIPADSTRAKIELLLDKVITMVLALKGGIVSRHCLSLSTGPPLANPVYRDTSTSAATLRYALFLVSVSLF